MRPTPVFARVRKHTGQEEKKMKERKKKKEKTHFLIGCFYALQICHRYAPGMFAA